MCEAVSIGAGSVDWLRELTNEQDLLRGSREMLEAFAILAGNISREEELILLLDTVHDPEGFVRLAALASGTLKRSRNFAEQLKRLSDALPVYRSRLGNEFPDGAGLIALGIRPGKGFSDAVVAARRVILLGGAKAEAVDAALKTAEAAGLIAAPGR